MDDIVRLSKKVSVGMKILCIQVSSAVKLFFVQLNCDNNFDVLYVLAWSVHSLCYICTIVFPILSLSFLSRHLCFCVWVCMLLMPEIG